MNELRGRLTIEFSDTNMHIMCTNRNCQYGKADYAHSWKEAFERVKWTAEETHKIPGDIALKTTDGKFALMYCPKCSNSEE